MLADLIAIASEKSGNSEALIIAFAGVGLALLSLAWQACSFFLSGCRVRIKVARGLLNETNIAYFPRRDRTPLPFDSSDEVIEVKVRNKGRLNASVVSCALITKEGALFNPDVSKRCPELPHRLEAKSMEKWYFSMSGVKAAESLIRSVSSEPHRALTKVIVSVELGDGRKRKETIVVPVGTREAMTNR